MKRKIDKERMTAATLKPRPLNLFLGAALLALACLPASAWEDRDKDGHYQQVNLVSDLPGVAILHRPRWKERQAVR